MGPPPRQGIGLKSTARLPSPTLGSMFSRFSWAFCTKYMAHVQPMGATSSCGKSISQGSSFWPEREPSSISPAVTGGRQKYSQR